MLFILMNYCGKRNKIEMGVHALPVLDNAITFRSIRPTSGLFGSLKNEAGGQALEIRSAKLNPAEKLLLSSASCPD
jgi:hypothetical protein